MFCCTKKTYKMVLVYFVRNSNNLYICNVDLQKLLYKLLSFYLLIVVIVAISIVVVFLVLTIK